MKRNANLVEIEYWREKTDILSQNSQLVQCKGCDQDPDIQPCKTWKNFKSIKRALNKNLLGKVPNRDKRV